MLIILQEPPGSQEDEEGEGEGGDADQFKDDELIRKECLSAFASKDYIMEPGVFKDLKR